MSQFCGKLAEHGPHRAQELGGQVCTGNLPASAKPRSCYHCNMLVEKDEQGDGVHATHPAVKEPWLCPANSQEPHVHRLPVTKEAQ